MLDPARYCREIERYLCQKNDGHLIRIVGPAFELVCGWAAQGVPFKIACRGIDRRVERYAAKGPRRRPVRIEFCEPDVLEAFDAWRRAVGVSHGGEEAERPRPGRRPGLERHLERVLARLTAWRASRADQRDLAPLVDRVIAELDQARAGARRARGAVREAVVTRLASLEVEILEAALAGDPMAAVEIEHEARVELEPFRLRMPAPAFQDAMRASIRRLVRERLGLPEIGID